MNVSVIIPTHFRDEMLKRALNSAVSQSYLPREVIVVDDTCRQETRDRVESAGEETPVLVRYMENRNPIGTSLGSINMGAKRATGDLLALLDDDDYWDREYLKKVNESIETANVDMTVGAKYNISEGSEITLGKVPPGDYVKNDWLLKNPGCGCSNFVVKRDCFLDVGGCDVRLKTSSDRDLFMRLIKRGYKYAVLKEPLVYHSNYGNRLTIQKRKLLRSNIILYKKYFWETSPIVHTKILKKLSIGIQYFRDS